MAQLDASDLQLLFFTQFLLLSSFAALYGLFRAWRAANDPSKTLIEQNTIQKPGLVGTLDAVYSTAADTDLEDTGGIDIHSTLLGELQPTDDRSDKFLPEGTLQKILTRHVVRNELMKDIPIHHRHDELKKVEDLVDFIMSEQDNQLGRRIFATALFSCLEGIRLRTAIQDFRVYKHNHPHFKLPITRSDAFFTNIGRKPDRIWDGPKITLFFNMQWTFLAPVLFPDMRNPILKLELRHILPWIKEDQKLIGSGSFGEVHQVIPSQSNIVDPAFQVRQLIYTP